MFNIKQFKWFQKAAIGITCLFFGLMVLVVIVAYSRSLGVTGIDMAKVQLMRQKAASSSTSQNP
jgi:hypothetical protein